MASYRYKNLMQIEKKSFQIVDFASNRVNNLPHITLEIRLKSKADDYSGMLSYHNINLLQIETFALDSRYRFISQKNSLHIAKKFTSYRKKKRFISQ